MKHEKNSSTRRPGIKLAIDWLKGVKMDIPYSRWVMFAIGTYVLCAAFDKLAAALCSLLPLLH
ncbi:hypothetical protein G5S34_17280 [Herbaspirillum frisingense]|jgi:hypothetical protein|uniref:hypothetical protein n=1 Tax=Herbaspirillum frisingense TaxID=92645 RepID=UPI001601537B|nr:hypothetical protein [Herbaspirillum frisingense]QNB08333.1 hypothetical protein G5S34_17280 [Herbaspirillum frisingense]